MICFRACTATCLIVEKPERIQLAAGDLLEELVAVHPELPEFCLSALSDLCVVGLWSTQHESTDVALDRPLKISAKHLGQVLA